VFPSTLPHRVSTARRLIHPNYTCVPDLGHNRLPTAYQAFLVPGSDHSFHLEPTVVCWLRFPVFTLLRALFDLEPAKTGRAGPNAIDPGNFFPGTLSSAGFCEWRILINLSILRSFQIVSSSPMVRTKHRVSRVPTRYSPVLFGLGLVCLINSFSWGRREPPHKRFGR